jgi:2,4-dienoyl-CoA reductase (NADPH2)
MVNASLGKEREYTLKPAEKKKKIMVIGGGPAGLELARVAAQRGHEVSLYEKNPRLGGLVPTAALVKGVERDDFLSLVDYFKTQMNKEKVAVILGKEVGPADINAFRPAVLAVTAGALPSYLEIPGHNHRSVVNSSDLHRKLLFFMRFFGVKTLQYLTRFWMPVAKEVVIVGGAIHGCETAEFLIKRGRRVTIVHTEKDLGDGIPVEDLMRFLPWLDKKGIPRYTEAKLEAVTDEGLIIITREGDRKTLAADTILVTLPYRSNNGIMERLEGKALEIHYIGSCREPGLIVDAIADGARIGHKI